MAITNEQAQELDQLLDHVAATDEGVSFDCAACGAVAGTVRLVPAGTTFDMGPPLGPQQHDTDGVRTGRWLGPAWKQVTPDTWVQIRDVLAATRPDPGALYAIDWEIASFWCHGCRQCYCLNHWDRFVIMDEGFYDYSEGWCPAGHRQMLDD